MNLQTPQQDREHSSPSLVAVSFLTFKYLGSGKLPTSLDDNITYLFTHFESCKAYFKMNEKEVDYYASKKKSFAKFLA